jgi:hypothetical protein
MQVADLTTQLSGAKAARSEMQRQLEDLQRRNATTGPEVRAATLQPSLCYAGAGLVKCLDAQVPVGCLST